MSLKLQLHKNLIPQSLFSLVQLVQLLFPGWSTMKQTLHSAEWINLLNILQQNNRLLFAFVNSLMLLM